MEALKRCSLSVICLCFLALTSIMLWPLDIVRHIEGHTLLGLLLTVCATISGIAGFVAMMIFLLAAIVVLFIPATKTIESFLESWRENFK